MTNSPTADCATPPLVASRGWPSKTLPLPETLGAWLTGVMTRVTWAVSESASGVAPSLTFTEKPSASFCVPVPPAVCA